MPKVSKTARLILANQYRIMALLAKSEGERKKHEATQIIFEQGFEEQYEGPFEDIHVALPASDCSEVYEILQMHLQLFESYKHLDSTEQAQFQPGDFQYKGIGGNEAKRRAYATLLMEKYSDVRRIPRGGTSHGPSLAEYRKMLEAHREIREEIGGVRDFTAAQIRQVLDAVKLPRRGVNPLGLPRR